jgi:MtN3 and saliva related transmembrane protein
MSFVTALGLLAATLTTVSFLPQVIKTWRSRNVGDLSPLTFGIFCVGVGIWLIYGLLVGDLPIILSNAVTFALALSLVVMALAFRTK